MVIKEEQSIASIVAEDYRAAAVLTTYGIDFCCKGGRSVVEVCRTKNIDPADLARDIAAVLERDTHDREDFRNWALTRLADHIEQVHHRYVEQRTPVLKTYLAKLCAVHGERHPELFEIRDEFNGCAGAMIVHMRKEELLLFPYIKQLESADQERRTPATPHFGTVDNPVRMMMDDHDTEGERFRRIRKLSWDYANPPDGCTTYSTALRMLQEFEEDLHKHIHLENNILFPRAVALEKASRTIAS
ncbi:MAG: iron-sulfur cluster repair di-iron protein [Flavobacteriales bacterium]|nr:iron-sulfur cluster repair di-iron protein [Flavobacteriales bacterium]